MIGDSVTPATDFVTFNTAPPATRAPVRAPQATPAPVRAAAPAIPAGTPNPFVFQPRPTQPAFQPARWVSFIVRMFIKVMSTVYYSVIINHPFRICDYLLHP